MSAPASSADADGAPDEAAVPEASAAESTRTLRVLPAELAWAIYFLIIPLGVAAMAHADVGLVPAAAFPFALNAIAPQVSYGVWYVVFQIGLIAILCVVRRVLDWRYLISFLVCSVGGALIDFNGAWMDALFPIDALWLRCLWFAIGFAVVAVTVYFCTRCQLPVMPIDTFPRDLCAAIDQPYARVKVWFDVVTLIATCLIGLAGGGALFGINVGTVVSALLMGRAVGLIQRIMDKRFTYRKHLPL